MTGVSLTALKFLHPRVEPMEASLREPVSFLESRGRNDATVYGITDSRDRAVRRRQQRARGIVAEGCNEDAWPRLQLSGNAAAMVQRKKSDISA